MIHSLVAVLKDGFTRASNLPKFNLSIPIVLGGGTALPAGFRERFGALVMTQDFPVRSPRSASRKTRCIRQPKELSLAR